MSKQLIKQIIIAILSVLFGYQAGNPDSMAETLIQGELPAGWLPDSEV
ncbi:MAG: hypothetical protein HRU12_18560 [Phaeodactylibacter sp.]|nr:hypothetical protein [Phaeodactylibacter sp.]